MKSLLLLVLFVVSTSYASSKKTKRGVLSKGAPIDVPSVVAGKPLPLEGEFPRPPIGAGFVEGGGFAAGGGGFAVGGGGFAAGGGGFAAGGQVLERVVGEHVHVINRQGIPFAQPFPVPVEQPVPIQIPHVINVPVERPYPVPVPVKIPVKVIKDVPYPVEQPIPFPVKKLVQIPVEVPFKVVHFEHVPVPVVEKVPIPVPHPIIVKRPVPVSIYTVLEPLSHGPPLRIYSKKWHH